MIKRSHVEFAISLFTSTTFWLALPAFNIINSGIAPLAMPIVILGEAVMLFVLVRLLATVKKRIATGLRVALTYWGLLGCNVCLSFLYVELMLAVTGSEIVSRPQYSTAVFACLVLQLVLLAMTAPWRNKLSRLQQHLVSRVFFASDNAAYRMVARKGKWIEDGLFVVGDDTLSDFYCKVVHARQLHMHKREQEAFAYLENSVLELNGCGYKGNTLFQVAFAIL